MVSFGSLRILSVVGFGLAVIACGDNDKRGLGATAGTDATTTTGDSATATADADATDTAVVVLPNACSAEAACERGQCRAGVCVEDPPANLASYATDPHGNVPTTEWPDLSCVDSATVGLVPAEPTTATLFGAVSRFGKGRTTVGIHVDVLLAADFDASACEKETDEDAIKECFRGLGTPVGSTVATHPPTPTSLPDVCTKHEECPLGYQCNDPHELGGTCVEEYGLYEIPNVPLETPIIIRSYATEGEANWHDTWVFNVRLHAHHVDAGRVQYDATMVSHGQWLLVTNTVSLPDIPVEHGVIGGRVRDCSTGTGVEGRPISNVVLDLARPARRMVYFNDLEDDTVPLVDRETTDIIGRFAALDVEPGWNRIAGSARVDGAVVSIGGADVYVIPNSLSIISWPGSQPYWRQ